MYCSFFFFLSCLPQAHTNNSSRIALGEEKEYAKIGEELKELLFEQQKWEIIAKEKTGFVILTLCCSEKIIFVQRFFFFQQQQQKKMFSKLKKNQKTCANKR